MGRFDAENSHFCPRDVPETESYLRAMPEGGMPFGFPALSASEYSTLNDWIRSGAPGPGPEILAQAQRPSNGERGERVLRKWEDFFNQRDMKTRISARYIFEHLFLAHLHFDEIPGDFFRLVRSRTPSPMPVDEIATVRPYDDPGAELFYYRFRRVSQTIVRKNHITYALDETKMNRFRDLFLKSEWEADHNGTELKISVICGPGGIQPIHCVQGDSREVAIPVFAR